MRLSIQMVERNNMSFLERMGKAFLIRDHSILRMTYCFGETITHMLLWALRGLVWFYLLSWILIVKFFPWLGCYLLRHTCGGMVSNVNSKLCSPRLCGSFHLCNFSIMSSWSIDVSGLHAILFSCFSMSYSSLCLQCHGRCLPRSGCSINVSWDQKYIGN